ncbi:hypothetical protein BO78DRAFT_145049 [Aspergillus sclerotiicarbonarius CBS 121057]|uniref:Uncharacterized protein n=1 Tax=Aspergillus sclerotiicarbonarius (strain CBS 121057 / IBT 28362) TaxID=1448318 RepID=A0A319E699_ASPSB|nr:hypothetical protein BO78DRAFT_145049 [Aspergillus sclerotiicarbonarius CBS 121057]
MSNRGWDPNKRVISDRRGSDADYDIRSPQSSHVGVQPPPSYYGPNFVNSGQGRSSSFTYGDIKEPKIPDPYVKRPQPYPPSVEAEYYAYKTNETQYTAAKKALALAKPISVGKNEPNALPRLQAGEQLATDQLVASNSIAASRSGFDHKYPTAYEDVEAKTTHQKVAKTWLSRSTRTRRQRETIRGKMDDVRRIQQNDADF